MNSTNHPSNPDSTSNEITRRNFMKKSALAAGAVTILGKGMAVAETTSACPSVDRENHKVHTSGCVIVKKVKVVFDNSITYPVSGGSDTSGRAFTGTLTYTVARFRTDGTKDGADVDVETAVTTGGFFDSTTMIQGPTCDTAFPEGSTYKLTLLPSGDIDGFSLETMPTGRVALEIHYKIRSTLGSSGCIVFTSGSPKPANKTYEQWKTDNDSLDWQEFDRLMRQTRNCKCQTTNRVPLTVEFTGAAASPKPNYIWK